MKCPNCHVECKDNVCPQCNGYFDEELMALSENALGDDDIGTPPPDSEMSSSGTARKVHKKHRPHKPHPSSDSGASVSTRRARAPLPVADDESTGEDDDDSEPAPPPAARSSGSSGGGYVSKYAQYWEDDDPKPPKKAEAPSQSSAKSPDSKAVSTYGQGIPEPKPSDGNLNGLPFDPLQLCRDTWNNFRRLSFMERIYIGSGVLLSLFSIIPWYSYKSTSEGSFGQEMDGYLTGQFFIFLLGLLPIAALVLQKQPQTLPQIPRKFLPLIPLGTGLVATAICVLSLIYLMAGSNMAPSWIVLLCSIGFSALIFLGSGGASLFGKKG